jgi:hypothetical protein
MTYRGRVQNGVVVLDGAPPLVEGTVVNVEPLPEQNADPRPGTAAAILRHAGTWQGDPGEIDRLLAELREMKWAEVEAQKKNAQDGELSL